MQSLDDLVEWVYAIENSSMVFAWVSAGLRVRLERLRGRLLSPDGWCGGVVALSIELLEPYRRRLGLVPELVSVSLIDFGDELAVDFREFPVASTEGGEGTQLL